MFFVSSVLSQLHQHPNCAQLPFMAGTCRQVQVSRLLAELSIGRGKKLLKKLCQALMAVTVQDYLSLVLDLQSVLGCQSRNSSWQWGCFPPSDLKAVC